MLTNCEKNYVEPEIRTRALGPIPSKVYSYTHDAHLPHPQFNGRNEVTAYLTNVASVDIQMKFKHQKWIAREIGRDNWEETEVDNCDTYQKMFAEQGNFYLNV